MMPRYTKTSSTPMYFAVVVIERPLVAEVTSSVFKEEDFGLKEHVWKAEEVK